jgi:hypothetical protein
MMVADQASASIDRLGIKPAAGQVPLGPNDEESHVFRQVVESEEIEVTTIHDVKGTGFRDQVVQNVDVVPRSDQVNQLFLQE